MRLQYKILSRRLHAGSEGNHEENCQDIRTPGKDLKTGPREFKSGVPSART